MTQVVRFQVGKITSYYHLDCTIRRAIENVLWGGRESLDMWVNEYKMYQMRLIGTSKAIEHFAPCDNDASK